MKNLVKLTKELYKFLTGEELAMNDDPPPAPVQQNLHHLSSPCYDEISNTNSSIGPPASHQQVHMPSLMMNDSLGMGQSSHHHQMH